MWKCSSNGKCPCKLCCKNARRFQGLYVLLFLKRGGFCSLLITQTLPKTLQMGKESHMEWSSLCIKRTPPLENQSQSPWQEPDCHLVPHTMLTSFTVKNQSYNMPIGQSNSQLARESLYCTTDTSEMVCHKCIIPDETRKIFEQDSRMGRVQFTAGWKPSLNQGWGFATTSRGGARVAHSTDCSHASKSVKEAGSRKRSPYHYFIWYGPIWEGVVTLGLQTAAEKLIVPWLGELHAIMAAMHVAPLLRTWG